jgi:Holliday junction resolvase RusA-like endonuclease
VVNRNDKVVRNEHGHVVMQHYIPSGHPVVQWRYVIAVEATKAMAGRPPIPRGVPVVLEIRFLLPRPAWANRTVGRGKSKRPKWGTGELYAPGKPDLDNLEKAVKDALTGIVWANDSQVCAYGPRHGKYYHAVGDKPRAEIQVWAVDLVPEDREDEEPWTGIEPEYDLEDDDD